MRAPVPFLSRLTASAKWRMALACLVAAVFFGGLAWWARWDPAVRFLPKAAPAEWIVFPKPPDAMAHPVAEFAAKFRRSFVAGKPPASAALSVRAMTRCDITLNGALLEPRAGSNWKRSLEFDVANGLRAGENKIVVTVFNATGPPALWLNLHAEGLSLGSDDQWEVSYAGATWSKARLASVPMTPGHGNLLEGGEATVRSLQARWPMLVLVAALTVIALLAVRPWWERWLAKTPVPGRDPASILTTRVLIALMVLWGILFANNLRSLPPGAGFDAHLHLEYIKYLLEHNTLPTAREGMEMYNPPLYYGLSAGALGLAGLGVSDHAGVVVLRLLTLAMGAAHLALILASLRLVFPGAARKQILGMLLAAFVPAHLYLSHYVTNETLMALLVTGTLYLALRILRDGNHSSRIFHAPHETATECSRRREEADLDQRTLHPPPYVGGYARCEISGSWKSHAALGACLGAALLTKMSALLAVPFVFGALGARLFAKRERDPYLWARTVGVTALVCLAVCGWHYLRSWVLFGTPLVGAWDEKSGFAWWQDEGYRTADYFTRFGVSLVRPYFSGMSGFGDGIYSTLWGDGLWGGAAGFEFRPPWNYDLMAAGYLFALLPTLGILLGGGVVLARFFRQPTAESFLLAGLPIAFGAALIYMTLRVPCYSQVKAFYGMLALLPVCVFAAVGLDVLCQRGRLLRLLVCGALVVWAANSYASFWIRGSSVSVLLAAGRQLAGEGHPLEAAERFAAALQEDPHHPLPRKYLTWLLVQNGQAAEAATLAGQAIAENPGDADSHVALGMALAAQGRKQEALESLRHAISLAPEHLMAHQKLAALLAELGMIEEFLKTCREGLRVAPVDPELHRLLKKIPPSAVTGASPRDRNGLW